MRFPTLMLLGALCLMALGCVAPGPGSADQQPTDPFCDPSCPPGSTCPPGYVCPPDQCPPGGCPPRFGEGSGVEISSGSTAYPINALAQSETKSGDCIPCQQVPQFRPPGVLFSQPAPIWYPQQPTVIPHQRPIVVAPQRPRVSPADEIKQGRFACEKCKRPTVGREWQEIWADDGTSVLCICKECYQTSTPQQREIVFRNYMARHGVDLRKKPFLEAAITEASRGF